MEAKKTGSYVLPSAVAAFALPREAALSYSKRAADMSPRASMASPRDSSGPRSGGGKRDDAVVTEGAFDGVAAVGTATTTACVCVAGRVAEGRMTAAGVVGASTAAARDTGTAGMGVGGAGDATSVGVGTDAEGWARATVGAVSELAASDFIGSDGTAGGGEPDGAGPL
jgi:hypothetical protein